jgi:hypothetical protein
VLILQPGALTGGTLYRISASAYLKGNPEVWATVSYVYFFMTGSLKERILDQLLSFQKREFKLAFFVSFV